MAGQPLGPFRDKTRRSRPRSPGSTSSGRASAPSSRLVRPRGAGAGRAARRPRRRAAGRPGAGAAGARGAARGDRGAGRGGGARRAAGAALRSQGRRSRGPACRLGALEDERAAAAAGREAQALEARFESLAAEQGAARAELAGLKAGPRGGEALAGQPPKLHAQKEALAEAVPQRSRRSRPSSASAPSSGAAALQARPTALQTAETPFAGISEQLDPAYAAEGATGGDGVRRSRARGGAARGARRPGSGPGARRGTVAARGAADGGDPFAAISRAADPALCAEGRQGGNRVRAPAPLEAKPRPWRPRTRHRRSTASASGWRRCRAGSRR